MRRERAEEIAHYLKYSLAEYCEKIEIAGSIRRLTPVVKDIELVAIPKLVKVVDLFGEKREVYSELDRYPWKDLGLVVMDGPRYKQIVLEEGINLDLFIVRPPAQWGVIFAIRTGPAEFSKWLVTRRRQGGALPDDCYVANGCVRLRWGSEGEEVIPMEREQDFFGFLGMEGVMLPSERDVRSGKHFMGKKGREPGTGDGGRQTH